MAMLVRQLVGFVAVLFGLGAFWFIVSSYNQSYNPLPRALPALVMVLFCSWIVVSGINKMAMIAKEKDEKFSLIAVVVYFLLLGAVFLQDTGKTFSLDNPIWVIRFANLVIIGWVLVDMFDLVYLATLPGSKIPKIITLRRS